MKSSAVRTKGKKEFGELLDELAEASGVTQTQIARELGAPVSQVNRFFRGHNEIYSSHLVRICKILKVDLEKIIKGKTRRLSDFDGPEI